MTRGALMTDEAARTNLIIRNETDVLEPNVPVAPAETPKPEEKEDVEDIEKRARKPPSDGPCRGCGKSVPINRLMLCFRCWVQKNLIEWGKGDWIPGDPHPSWCGCGLPGGHPGSGN